MSVKKRSRINQNITAEVVCVIDEKGEKIGDVALEEALKKAEKVGLDLVEVAPNATPPVCKFLDYTKYVYAESKKKQQSRKKQKHTVVKEMKFRPGTDVGDYETKLRNLKRFLDDSFKIKVTVRFRGREMAFSSFGYEMMQRIIDDLKNEAVVEQEPKLEGRQMVLLMAPKRTSS